MCFLLGQSKVFETMLSGKFKEGDEKEVRIEDCGFEVVEQMIEYMYTGNVTGIGKAPQELLMLAERVKTYFLNSNFKMFTRSFYCSLN